MVVEQGEVLVFQGFSSLYGIIPVTLLERFYRAQRHTDPIWVKQLTDVGFSNPLGVLLSREGVGLILDLFPFRRIARVSSIEPNQVPAEAAPYGARCVALDGGYVVTSCHSSRPRFQWVREPTFTQMK